MEGDYDEANQEGSEEKGERFFDGGTMVFLLVDSGDDIGSGDVNKKSGNDTE